LSIIDSTRYIFDHIESCKNKDEIVAKLSELGFDAGYIRDGSIIAQNPYRGPAVPQGYRAIHLRIKTHEDPFEVTSIHVYDVITGL